MNTQFLYISGLTYEGRRTIYFLDHLRIHSWYIVFIIKILFLYWIGWKKGDIVNSIYNNNDKNKFVLDNTVLIMGIIKLMDFLKSKAPSAIYSKTLPDYKRTVLAIDASNWIYQFLIKTQVIRNSKVQMPTDWLGNQTGHLIGMLSRVQLCFKHQITPVWVFDGKPPEQKYAELKRRRQKREKAEQLSEQAIEEEQSFDLHKMSQRTVKISSQEKQAAKKLIQLIGLPAIQSESEAEPQCAAIARQGLVYGVISEDLDTLTFGCPYMIRGFNQKNQILEISLNEALQTLQLTYEQFIDFCILCGCDYTSKIAGIGPVKAHKMIKDHGTIEGVLQFIVNDQKLFNRHTIPDDFNHLKARQLFTSPNVRQVSEQQLIMKPFNQDAFTQFLQGKQFSMNRINNWLERVHKTNMLK